MSTFWLEYAVFPVLLFFLSACLVTGLPVASEILHRRQHRLQKFAGRHADEPSVALTAVAR
jgi:hypothetical protein